MRDRLISENKIWKIKYLERTGGFPVVLERTVGFPLALERAVGFPVGVLLPPFSLGVLRVWVPLLTLLPEGCC